MIQQNKELYRNSCIKDQRIPIFHRPQWLDAACGRDNWEVLYLLNNNKIEACLPYMKEKKYWLKLSLMPLLTPYLGYWQSNELNEKHSRKTIAAIQAEISTLDLMAMRNRPNHNGSLDWIWKGWELETKYTVEVTPDLDTSLSGLKSNLRNHIKKAAEVLTVENSDDIHSLYSLIQKSFSRTNSQLPFSFENLQNFHKVIQENNWGEILFAKDLENNNVAGHYFIWDKERIYNWVSGFVKKDDLRGATQLVLLKGIQKAKSENKIFDFEGGLLPGIGTMFKSFPTKEVPYLVSRKFKNKWIKALWSLRQ